MNIRQWLERHMPSKLVEGYRRAKFTYGFKRGHRTWSQEGEDLILGRLFAKRDGFYADIGAHHPYRYSNTYLLHTLGWRGINIDALPQAIDLFRRARPDDINIHAGVSRVGGKLTYYQFNDPAFNTFDERLAENTCATVPQAKLVGVCEVSTYTLREIFDKHLPPNITIDVMNVDVEGFDQEVIESNDWLKYRPAVVLVEAQAHSVESLVRTPLFEILSSEGYELFAKCVHTAIFRLRDP